MTVYSKAISGSDFGGMSFSRPRARTRVNPNQTVFDFNKTQEATVVSSVYKVNLFLLVMASLMLFSYIFLSNFVTSQAYALNVRKSEFNQLSAVAAANNMEVPDQQDLNALMTFAQKSGMVEAKDIGVILEDGNFALSR